MQDWCSVLQMGNAESYSELPPPPSPPPPPPPLPQPPERPLRSILRPPNPQPSMCEPEVQRRSVVFADQFSLDRPPSNCQPFLLGERVTHFGAEIVTTRGSLYSSKEEDYSTSRRLKRPPNPPPRRASATDAADPQGVEDIRKKMRLDLQQSRAEYERLRNLRAPLRRRVPPEVPPQSAEPKRFTQDPDATASSTEALKETVPFPQPLRSLPFKTQIDKVSCLRVLLGGAANPSQRVKVRC